MKTLILTILAICSLPLAIPQASADDTNLPPVPVSSSSFFETATAYFTSFNTNAEMGWIQRGELAAGIVSLRGPVNLANNLRLSYEVANDFAIEALTRDSGIAGTWLSASLGASYSFKRWDAKLTPYAHAGYRFNEPNERWFGEIGLRVNKKMTRYTFAGVGLGVQLPTGRPVLLAETGFVF